MIIIICNFFNEQKNEFQSIYLSFVINILACCKPHHHYTTNNCKIALRSRRYCTLIKWRQKKIEYFKQMQHNSIINFTKQCTTGQTSNIPCFNSAENHVIIIIMFNIHHRCSVFLFCMPTLKRIVNFEYTRFWEFSLFPVLLYTIVNKFVV